MNSIAESSNPRLRAGLAFALAFVIGTLLLQGMYIANLFGGWVGLLAPVAVLVVAAAVIWIRLPRWRAGAVGLAAGPIALVIYGLLLMWE